MTETTTKSPHELADDAIHQCGYAVSTPLGEFDRFGLAKIVAPFGYEHDDDSKGDRTVFAGPHRTLVVLHAYDDHPPAITVERRSVLGRSFAGEPLVRLGQWCPIGALTAILNDEGWQTAATIAEDADLDTAHAMADKLIADAEKMAEQGMTIKRAIAQGWTLR